ncbi:hypothetical protein ACKLNR_005734 [Fusarium oxysporum f. sp. zingiberi]
MKTPIRYSASSPTETSRVFPIQETEPPRQVPTPTTVASCHTSLKHYQPTLQCRHVSNDDFQRTLHVLRPASDLG